tara:strand:- start:38334 stop:38579 length:246 start_codon:yes stop_codon:yes gene_type:complete
MSIFRKSNKYVIKIVGIQWNPAILEEVEVSGWLRFNKQNTAVCSLLEEATTFDLSEATTLTVAGTDGFTLLTQETRQVVIL